MDRRKLTVECIYSEYNDYFHIFSNVNDNDPIFYALLDSFDIKLVMDVLDYYYL